MEKKSAHLFDLNEIEADDITELLRSDVFSISKRKKKKDKKEKLVSVSPSHSSKANLKHEWSDDLCLATGKKHCKWKRIPVNQMAGHLINFVNLWFSPHATEHVEISSTIRNVLLMMPLAVRDSEELLFKDVLDSARKRAQIPSPIIDADKIIIKDPFVNHLNSEEKAKVLAFHEWLKGNFGQLKLLEKTTSHDQTYCPEYHVVSQKLRTVLGFCALILMRLKTKNEHQIKRYFYYGASQALDRLFPEAGFDIALTAPVPEFFQLFLDNPEIYIKDQILYLVVFQYLKSVVNNDKSSQLAKQILEKGCLNALEGNGMGLVTMFRDVKLLYPYIEERQLLWMIVDQERDVESQKKLIKFLDTYGQPDKLQYSWKWARILSPHYFSDLNIKSHLNLCSKFAVLLIDKNPGILQHKGFSGLGKRCYKDTEKWAQSAKHELSKLNRDMNQI